MRERGVSQAGLARSIGVSQPTIYRIIHGEVHGSKHLHRIARELLTTPAYLVGETDDPDEGAPPPPLPPTVQHVMMPVALPAEAALERMFLGLLKSMPSMLGDEAGLARELAKLLPTGLRAIEGPLRFVATDGRDAVDDDPADRSDEPPARRRA